MPLKQYTALVMIITHANYARGQSEDMHLSDQFEVTVRRKVPYVTHFLAGVLITCVLVFVFIELLFLPVRNASVEVQSFYFFFLIPEVLKKALVASSITFVLVLPVYLKFRYHRPAALTFLPAGILLKGKHIDICLATANLLKVYCMDPKNSEAEPTGELIVYFQEKDQKLTRISLKHYEEAEDFVERLMGYEVDFVTYDFEVNPDAHNEE
jgi:hypothetical protein